LWRHAGLRYEFASRSDVKSQPGGPGLGRR